MKTLCILIGLFLFPSLNSAQPGLISPEVLNNIHDRVDFGENVAIVIGVIAEGEESYHAYGTTHINGDLPVDKDTLFSIGSVTKVLSAITTRYLAETTSLNLSDSFTKHLPKGFDIYSTIGKAQSIEHLLTHTSGLPRLPSNLDIQDPNNPYQKYDSEKLMVFVNHYQWGEEDTFPVLYSNVGYGLVGQIIQHTTGKGYEESVSSLILKPLGLSRTGIWFQDDTNQAKGHFINVPVPDWTFSSLEATGAFKSSIRDMIQLLRFNLFPQRSLLGKAVQDTHHERAIISPEGLSIGLAWHILKAEQQTIYFHNGETGGYHAFIGFDKGQKKGVAVLTNSKANIDDIGFHILSPNIPLKGVRKPIELSKNILQSYVGQYALLPDVTLTISIDDLQLYAQATGEGAFKIYPESEIRFFYRGLDATIEFNTHPDQSLDYLLFKTPNSTLKAPRLSPNKP